MPAASLASSAESSAGCDGLDAPNLGLDTDERRHLARVPPQDGHVDGAEDVSRRCRPIGRRAGADRIEHDRDAALVRGLAGEDHRLDPVLRERADVQHERPGEADHLAYLFLGVRHHGQRSEREDRVRRLVHHDVVRDVVDERPALADDAKCGAWIDGHARPFTLRTSTGPSPAPISTRPFWTAAEAASDAPRAASSSESPRARSAARVAECVQPAPCVARTS